MTIKDIAQMAGVSISTVSKVMNRKDASISPETRERVLRIAKEFHYSPYSTTIGAGTKTYLLGVIVRSAEANQTLSGVIQAARELGYTILVSESAGQTEQEMRGISAMCRHNVDGVLWEPVCRESLSLSDSLRSAGIPFLLCHTDLSEQALNTDFEQLGYNATRELVLAHHTDIACLLSDGTRTEPFFNGYRKCLFEAGIPYQESLVFHDISEGLIHKITGRALTGIVSSHFGTSLCLYRELSAMHYQIPQDVSLISLRSDSREVTAYPEISTYTVPHLQFGRHLCAQMVSLMENPEYVPLPFEANPKLDNKTTIAAPYSCNAQPIVVVGSINIDNYLKMDQLPTTGKSTLTSHFSVYPGGKGFNQAVGAAKLGAPAVLIGAVGSDMDSDLIYTALQQESIDSRGVYRFRDSTTGKAYIFVQKDGDSLISILSGANGCLTPENILQNSRLFENSRFCLVQTEIPQDTVLTACRTARSYGAATILKPSACASLDPELIRQINILVPNYDEICLLAPGATLSDRADYFLNQGVETVIVTLGNDGCYVKTTTLEEHVPAAHFPAIDNTGACDAFISALAVYLRDGFSLSRAVRIASYAAGFSITREGVSNSLVDRDTLEAYLRQQEPDLLSAFD